MLYSPDEVFPDAIQAFVERFCNLRFEDLPAEVVQATKNQVLDLLGVALGGSGEAGIGELLDLIREWGGTAQSTVIRYGDRAPAPNVAQVNATMAHALDFDDVHEDAIMHPGVVTIPTALAMGEYVGGMTGRELITCVVLGTDLICRLGLATRPGENIHKYGWHLTSIYGFLTAAAVAGRVLGLDEDRLTSAIGIGYHQSAGNGQAVKDGVLTKRMGPGFAVRGGIMAALLAKRGVTGARNILEGRAGMYHVYHGASFSRDILLAELGERYETMNVSIKPYPCCRGVHPFIDAGLSLATRYDLRPADIDKVLINCGQGTYFLLATPLETKSRPTNPVDSQF
ncbi:MAG: MmgE/PrpD family protein, partial [Anaerolineae bacterium]